MKEQFCDYETSLKLKNLGFDEECIAFTRRWNQDTIYPATTGKYGEVFSNIRNTEFTLENEESNNTKVALPLYQQVIDWLDSKGYFIAISLYSTLLNVNQWVWDIKNNKKNYSSPAVYSSRKEALQEGINKALSILEQQSK